MLSLPLAVGDVRELRGLRAVVAARGVSDASDVGALESIRNGAVEAGDLPRLLAYHHLLGSVVVPRLSGDESDAKFEFSWSDPFVKAQAKLLSSKLHFDWGNVLWNYGATLLLQGAKMDLNTDESIRDACKLMQQASGAFEFIKSTILPELQAAPPSPSSSALSESGLTMASSLALAQAQFCFYKKAVKDHRSGSMKPGIVAKLAKQTAVFYGATAASCKHESSLKGDTSYFAHADFKARCFHATAEYWQALALQETAPGAVPGRGYGEAVARLGVAERLLAAALAQAAQHKLPSSVSATADELLRTVAAMRGESERLNDQVYLGLVPTEAMLEAVPPVAMAKPISLPPEPAEGQPGRAPSLFRQLVPAGLRKIQAALQDRAAALRGGASKQAATATDAARALLSSIGLPSSLEVYKQGAGGAGIPDSLWDKVLAAQQQGALPGLESQYSQLQATAAECEASLDALAALLSREDEADAAAAAGAPGAGAGAGPGAGAQQQQQQQHQQQHHQQQQQQQQLTEGFDVLADVRAGAERMLGALREARDSDASWSGALSAPEPRDLLLFLSRSKAEMVATVPRPDEPLLDLLTPADEDRGREPAVLQLEALLVALVGVFARRDAAEAAVAALCDQDFATLLVGRGTGTGTGAGAGAGLLGEEDPAALADSLLDAPAAPHLAALAATVAEQEALLPQVLSANASFQSLRACDPASQAKDAIVQRAEMAVAQFAAVATNLSQAAAFYQALRRRLAELLGEARDAVCARGLLRDEQAALRSQERADWEMARRLDAEMQAAAAAAAAAAPGATAPGSGAVVQPGFGPGPGLGPGQAPSAGPSVRAAPTAYSAFGPGTGTGTGPAAAGAGVGLGAGVGVGVGMAGAVSGLTLQGPGIPQGVSYGTPVAGPPPSAVGLQQPPLQPQQEWQQQPSSQPQQLQQLQQQQQSPQQWQQQYTYPASPLQQQPPQPHQPQYYQQPQPQPQPQYQQQPQQQYQQQYQPQPQYYQQQQQPPQQQQQQQQQQYAPAPHSQPPPQYQQTQYQPSLGLGPGPGIAPEPSRAQRMQQLGLTEAERAQLEARIARLAEMGFTDRAAVSEALLVSGMNEEAALNALLGAPTVAQGSVLPQPQQPPPAPQPAAQPRAGLFGLPWGRG